MNFVSNTTSSPASTLQLAHDTQTQLRALYVTLLEHQEHYDEFKQLLSLYAMPPEMVEEESADSARVRATINNKIRSWVAGPFNDLSVSQIVQWRAIVVDERLNVTTSPWKEQGAY